MQGLVTEESLAWFMWGKGSRAALKSWALELGLVLTVTESSGRMGNLLEPQFLSYKSLRNVYLLGL